MQCERCVFLASAERCAPSKSFHYNSIEVMIIQSEESKRQDYLQVFKKQLSNNQLSTYFVEKMFSGMGVDLEHDLGGILLSKIQRYAQIPEIKPHFEKGNDIRVQLNTIINTFPTFLFLISYDLSKNPAYYDHARLLQIIGVACNITKHPNQQSESRLFLAQINPEDDLQVLQKKASAQNSDHSYFPKILHQDFIAIKHDYKNLRPTKDMRELIDLLFCFRGVLRVFLKYYFSLLCRAQNDEVAKHVDHMFSGLFAAFKLQEIKFWNNFSDSVKLQNQLLQTIKLDSPKSRHPVLRKHIFESLKQYNPIIKDARLKFTPPGVRSNLENQLGDFKSLSVLRSSLLLDTVQKCKGRSYVIYLLTQILTSDKQKLFTLDQLLQEQGEKANKELVKLVSHFAGKLTSTQKRANLRSANQTEMSVVLQTADSLRRSKALKRLKDQEGKGLTSHQIARLVDGKLKRLQQRVQNEGALTQDKISEYLSNYSDSAQIIMTEIPIDKQEKVIEDFKNSSNKMLKDIANKGQLTSDQVAEYEKEIEGKILELENADTEKRAEIIDQIGVTLVNATVKSHEEPEEGDRAKSKDKKVPARRKYMAQDQVDSFLKERLQTLYQKVKIEGAITEDKVSDYLNDFAHAAQDIVVEIPAELHHEVIANFKASSVEILQEVTDKGYLNQEEAGKFRIELQSKVKQLDQADPEKRLEIVNQIGISLTEASTKSDQKQKIRFDQSISKSFKNITPKNSTNALTADQVPHFLDNYLKNLYERVKKEGALTQDKISEYLAQFANIAQEIVIEIPLERQEQVIENFKSSTDDILINISVQGNLTPHEVDYYKNEIHLKIQDLDTPDVEKRIEIVDQISVTLSEASIESASRKKSSQPDERFLKKDLIPYGFDEHAKRISVKDFFSFPFGTRKGPEEEDWFAYHVRYLQIAVDKNKLKVPIFKQISEALPYLPKVKYKKYFNIFPTDKFEETTFLAVFDLWQNKALEKLIAI